MTTAQNIGYNGHFGPTRPRGEWIFDAIRAFAMTAICSWRRWCRVRGAIVELKRLDDRMLSDIGLSRSTLYAAAREAHGFKDRGQGDF